jgi:hypothetical protein
VADEKRKIIANLGDTKVTIEGPSEQFGSLDLQVKAIKGLIEMLDFKFVEEEDPGSRQKVYLALLDTIGAMLKVDMVAFNNDDTRNIETVHQFLTWVLKERVHEQPGYAELLDQEDAEEPDWN